MSNPYHNLDIRAAEDFMVFLHKQKYRLFNESGATVSWLKAFDDYSLHLAEEQKKIDEQVSRCETEKICLSCGEPGFPYCDRHDNTDPYHGALPEIPDSEIPDSEIPRF